MDGSEPTTEPATRAALSWRWLWGLVAAVLAVGFWLGPLAIVLLGVGLLAGGLWVRHEASDPRDRTIAGGLASAGAAILVVTGLLVVFLMPATVSGGGGVPDEAVEQETQPDAARPAPPGEGRPFAPVATPAHLTAVGEPGEGHVVASGHGRSVACRAGSAGVAAS